MGDTTRTPDGIWKIRTTNQIFACWVNSQWKWPMHEPRSWYSLCRNTPIYQLIFNSLDENPEKPKILTCFFINNLQKIKSGAKILHTYMQNDTFLKDLMNNETFSVERLSQSCKGSLEKKILCQYTIRGPYTNRGPDTCSFLLKQEKKVKMGSGTIYRGY